MKLSKTAKRVLIVVGTVIGALAIILVIAFAPLIFKEDKAQKPTNTTDTSATNDIVVAVPGVSVEEMSKEELIEMVKQLEDENAQLQDEVEKYKILAEQTTQSVVSPTVSSPKPSSGDDSDDEEYKDSSEYYDENYKDYTSDDEDDDKNTSSDKKPSTPSGSSSTSDSKPSGNNSSGDDKPATSDTGL